MHSGTTGMGENAGKRSHLGRVQRMLVKKEQLRFAAPRMLTGNMERLDE